MSPCTQYFWAGFMAMDLFHLPAVGKSGVTLDPPLLLAIARPDGA